MARPLGVGKRIGSAICRPCRFFKGLDLGPGVWYKTRTVSAIARLLVLVISLLELLPERREALT